MLKLKTIEDMREVLNSAYATPAKSIAMQALDEIEELVLVLGDIKGVKRCFCSMPVHSRACAQGLKWLAGFENDT